MLDPTFQNNTQRCAVVADHGLSTQHFRRDKPLDNYIMKKTFLFLVSFLGVLVLAVFLSPLLFQVLDFKFERIFNRIVMIGTLVCVAVFMRIRKDTFIQYGLAWQKNSFKNGVVAFLVLVLGLSVYVWIQTFFGEVHFSANKMNFFEWFKRIFLALFTGLLVGIIEEFFFRGALFQFSLCATRNRLGGYGLALSLIVTNTFYSIVHFVHAKRPFIDATPNFKDSLRLLAAPFESFGHFSDFWPGFVGLFIFGLMLNGLLLRTKSLYASIGLHAGAVFFIKTDGLLVDFGAPNFFWGSSKMYDGVMGWCDLAILYIILITLFNRGPWAVNRGAQ